MSKLIKLNPSAKTCATLSAHSPLEMRHPAEKPVKTPPPDFFGQFSLTPPPVKKTI
ncbi:hypothetical protein [Pseudomonas juntendi]